MISIESAFSPRAVLCDCLGSRGNSELIAGVARGRELQFQRQILRNRAAVEDATNETVHRIKIGRSWLDERIDEDVAFGHRQNLRLPRADQQRSWAQVGAVEPTALEARDSGTRKTAHAQIKLGVLGRTSWDDAFDDDHSGIDAVQHRFGRDIHTRSRIADAPPRELLQHNRPHFSRHQPPASSLEPNHQAISTHDDRLEASDDGFTGHRSAHDRIDIENEIGRARAVLLWSIRNTLNDFATGRQRRRDGGDGGEAKQGGRESHWR